MHGTVKHPKQQLAGEARVERRLAFNSRATEANRRASAGATAPRHAHIQCALQTLRPLRRDGWRRQAPAADHEALHHEAPKPPGVRDGRGVGEHREVGSSPCACAVVRPFRCSRTHL